MSAGPVLAACAAVGLVAAALLARRRLTLGRDGLAPSLVGTAGIGGVALCVFVAYTVQIASHAGPTVSDDRAIGVADDLRSGVGLGVAKAVTALGSLPATAVLVVIVAALVGARGRSGEAVVLVASAVAIYAAVHVTKAAVDRPRPPHPLAGSTLSAFPSGHAAYSTSYVAMAVTVARSRAAGRGALVTLGILVAAAIGVSRVYLRVHWLSDVVAGWALGAAIFGLVAAAAVVVGHFRNNDDGERAAAGGAESAPDRA